MDPFADYDNHDATGLAELVRTKEVHPRELLEAAIRRIQHLNPSVNAVTYTSYGDAREAADREMRAGAFAGVPFLIKDLGAAWAGKPFSSSSRSRRDHVPVDDDEIVRRFREAGLVIMGKTNTPEFGLAPVTESELHGPARNPWDPERTPCGSSGGSAAAVAAGMVPMAHANDGGGSIRMPASACGLFGIKPTRGRSTWGPRYIEGWLGLSEQHAITRSVRDSARLLDAVHGAEPGTTAVPAPPLRPYAEELGADPGRLRIAYHSGALLDSRPLHAECVGAVEDAARLCADLGHEVEPAAPDLPIDELVRAFITLAAAEAHFQIREGQRLTGRTPHPADFEPVTWLLGLIGRKRSAGDLADAIHTIRTAGRTMAEFMENYDLLLTSTLAEPPWPIGALDLKRSELVAVKALRRLPARRLLELVVDQLTGEILRPMPNTPLFNMTGQPAMSVPLHWNGHGLPLGVQFAARLGGEDVLFRLATQLEEARPWWDRRPPISSAAAA